MAKQKIRYPRTAAQRKFRKDFGDNFLFEFMEDTTVPFRQRAEFNLRWMRDHVIDHLQDMESTLNEIAPEREG